MNNDTIEMLHRIIASNGLTANENTVAAMIDAYSAGMQYAQTVFKEAMK
jgi:hypothetical protein